MILIKYCTTVFVHPVFHTASLVKTPLPNISKKFVCIYLYVCDFIAPPVVTKGPQGFTRSKPGETVVFNCSFHGDPEPTVTWSKDGVAIKDEGRFLIVIKEGYTELEIEKLQYSDAGTYQIALANSYGNAWSEAILDMNGESLVRVDFRSLFKARLTSLF